MKKIKSIILLLLMVAYVAAQNEVPRVYVPLGETVKLLSTTSHDGYKKLRGQIQWQFWSTEGWYDLPGETKDSLVFKMNISSTGKYRNYTKEGSCRIIYSDAVEVHGNHRIEGEDLLKSNGSGGYLWKDDVSVSDSTLNISTWQNTAASNKKMLFVDFYGKDSVEIEFKVPPVINPGIYRLRYQATNNPSCLFEVFVNGEKEGFLDTSFGSKYSLGEDSVLVPDTRSWYEFSKRIIDEFGVHHTYNSRTGLNNYDWKVIIKEKKELTIKFLLLNGGLRTGEEMDAFVLDYLEFIPVESFDGLN